MSAGQPDQQATPPQKTEEKPSSSSSSSGGSSSSSKSPSRSSLKSMSFDEASSALSPGDGGWLAYKGSGDMAPSTGEAQQIAQSGLQGPSSPMPSGDAAAIEQTTGVDISQGRVHSGPAAQEAASTLGVEGYAMGGQVAFASASPSRETKLHEGAHVAQQVGVPGGRRPGARRRAGAVAVR